MLERVRSVALRIVEAVYWRLAGPQPRVWVYPVVVNTTVGGQDSLVIYEHAPDGR